MERGLEGGREGEAEGYRRGRRIWGGQQLLRTSWTHLNRDGERATAKEVFTIKISDRNSPTDLLLPPHGSGRMRCNKQMLFYEFLSIKRNLFFYFKQIPHLQTLVCVI